MKLASAMVALLLGTSTPSGPINAPLDSPVDPFHDYHLLESILRDCYPSHPDDVEYPLFYLTPAPMVHAAGKTVRVVYTKPVVADAAWLQYHCFNSTGTRIHCDFYEGPFDYEKEAQITTQIVRETLKKVKDCESNSNKPVG